ncbi:MAG: 50S ribosomal protein L17 [Spirochaetia bacterium]|nr:50S ribosomal protein L17 [Spirochaetia bacterium]
MKHKIGFNRLGRKSSHRKSLHRNMTTSLFRYERIKTTKAKALAIRRTAEKMITRAKMDSVHNRRIMNKDIKDKEILAKLFTEIGPRYKERPGGYTRILKLGYRQGDAAEMVLLELVEEEVAEQKQGKKKSTKKAKSAAAPTKAKENAEATDTESNEAPAEETATAEAAPAEETEAEAEVEAEESTEKPVAEEDLADKKKDK